nr:MAG TPA: hypothetical protein [Caudoviricetes sp.]DAR41156.1 MAG TPA: hypothetical protein [Caudoviricetes sp.]
MLTSFKNELSIQRVRALALTLFLYCLLNQVIRIF